MEGPRLIIPGVVQNGVVVPVEKNRLAEGARVEIALPIAQVPPELQEEFDGWERLGDEAWSLIDQWEKDEPKSFRATAADLND